MYVKGILTYPHGNHIHAIYIKVCQRYFLITNYNIGYHTCSYHVKHHYTHCLLEKDQLLVGDKDLFPWEHSLRNLNLAEKILREKILKQENTIS